MIIAKQCIHIDFCDAVVLFRYRQWRSRRCASKSRIGKIGQMWMWFRCAWFLFTYFVSFNHQIKSSAHRTICLLYGVTRVLPFRSIPFDRPGPRTQGRIHRRTLTIIFHIALAQLRWREACWTYWIAYYINSIDSNWLILRENNLIRVICGKYIYVVAGFDAFHISIQCQIDGC